MKSDTIQIKVEIENEEYYTKRHVKFKLHSHIVAAWAKQTPHKIEWSKKFAGKCKVTRSPPTKMDFTMYIVGIHKNVTHKVNAIVENGSKLNGFAAWTITKEDTTLHYTCTHTQLYICVFEGGKDSLFSIILFSFSSLVFRRLQHKKKKRKIKTILNGFIRIFIFRFRMYYVLFHAGRFKSTDTHIQTCIMWCIYKTIEGIHNDNKRTIVHLLNGRQMETANSRAGTPNSLPQNDKQMELFRGQMAFCVLLALSFYSLFFRFFYSRFLIIFVSFGIVFILLHIHLHSTFVLLLLLFRPLSFSLTFRSTSTVRTNVHCCIAFVWRPIPSFMRTTTTFNGK